MNHQVTVELGDFCSPERVLVLDGQPGKRAALNLLVDATATHTSIGDKAEFRKAIFEREEVTTTALGCGTAVPHARLASIARFVISIGICRAGIDYAASDGLPVRILVMIAAPDHDHTAYLKLLASVAMRLKGHGLREALLLAPNGAAAVRAFTHGF